MHTENSKDETNSSFLGSHEAILASLNNKTKQSESSPKPEETKESALKTPADPTPKHPSKKPISKPMVHPQNPPKPPPAPPRPARVIPPKPPVASKPSITPKPSAQKKSLTTPTPQIKRTPIFPASTTKKKKKIPSSPHSPKQTSPTIGGIIGAIVLIVACLAIFIYQYSNKKNIGNDPVKEALTSKTEPPISTLNEGLIGHWHFNNLSGTTLPDSSSYQRDGILQNGFSSDSSVVGVSGTALKFNGEKDVIKIPALPHSTVITVSIWSKSPDPQSTNHLISNHPSWFLTGYNQGIIRFSVQTTQGEKTALFNKPNNPEDDWHHYVGVYDGQTITTYLDGIVSNKITWNGDLISGSGTRIGSYWKNLSPQNIWTGSLDEARVYNRPLSAEEVLQLTQLEKPLTESN